MQPNAFWTSAVFTYSRYYQATILGQILTPDKYVMCRTGGLPFPGCSTPRENPELVSRPLGYVGCKTLLCNSLNVIRADYKTLQMLFIVQEDHRRAEPEISMQRCMLRIKR